jgi:hypothetical protein
MKLARRCPARTLAKALLQLWILEFEAKAEMLKREPATECNQRIR